MILFLSLTYFTLFYVYSPRGHQPDELTLISTIWLYFLLCYPDTPKRKLFFQVFLYLSEKP